MPYILETGQGYFFLILITVAKLFLLFNPNLWTSTFYCHQCILSFCSINWQNFQKSQVWVHWMWYILVIGCQSAQLFITVNFWCSFFVRQPTFSISIFGSVLGAYTIQCFKIYQFVFHEEVFTFDNVDTSINSRHKF